MSCSAAGLAVAARRSNSGAARDAGRSAAIPSNRTPLPGLRASGCRPIQDESADIACPGAGEYGRGMRVGPERVRPPAYAANMNPIQQDLPLPLWGGARRGAGRKRKSLRKKCPARCPQAFSPRRAARHRAHAQGGVEPSHAPVLPSDQARPRARLRAVRVPTRALLRARELGRPCGAGRPAAAGGCRPVLLGIPARRTTARC